MVWMEVETAASTPVNVNVTKAGVNTEKVIHKAKADPKPKLIQIQT